MEGTMGNPTDDNQLYVKFYKQAVEMKAESLKEGRPIFKEIDYISIIVPGDPTNQVERKVRDEDKQRWHAIWQRYEAGETAAEVSGTPINEWAAIPLAQKAMLKHLEIHTVEALSNLSDTALQRIGMGGFELRDKAKAFLDSAKGGAEAMKYAVENRRLSDEIADLKKQVEALAALAEKPKRTRKAA